jgi:PAS domain S-box-containing protein
LAKRAWARRKPTSCQKVFNGQSRYTERELRIVKRIQEIFLTIPDDEMYAEVLDVILEAMDSRHGLFGYINPDDGSVVFPSMTRDVWDRCQIPEKNIVFPRETWGGMWGRSLKEKKTLYSNKPFRVPQGHLPIKRSMSLPILYHNQLIGHIHVANKETDYDEKDRLLLETVAGHIAPVLHARQQREKLEEERKQAEKLIGIQRDLGIALSGARNLEKALALVIDTATRLEGMDCGGIYLVDPDTGAIVLQYAKGLSPDFIKQVSHYDKDSDNTRLVMKKKPVFVEYSKLKIKKHKIEHLESLKATAIIPILHHGHVIACMNIASHTHKSIPVSAQNTLVAIASQAGSVLARLQTEEKLAQYRQSLEKQVEERTMGFSKANEQLRKEVSRRKEVNKALSESEERFRNLVETSQDLIWKCDGEGRFTYLNPAWEQTLGYKTEEMLGRQFTEFKTPEQAEKDLKTFKSILSGQEIYGYETTYISKSKKTVFLVFNARIFKDPDGKMIGTLGTQGTAYNITEYKQAVEQLRFQSKIVKNMSEGVNLVRAGDHKIVFTNPKFDQMFGYSATELMGKHVSILNAPDEEQPEEIAKKIIESLDKNNYWQGEIKNIKKDGTLFWSSASISQFDHPEHGKVYISIQNDITERKWALEELRESEERYRTLVENIKLGITLIDADYNIAMVNTAVGAMFNKTASELIGKKCYREFEKRKKVCVHCPGTRAMTTGLSQEVDTEGVLNDGSRFQVRIQAFPSFGIDGKASGFIEVVEDISENKKVEEQINKLSHAVEQSPTAIVVTDTTGNIEYVNPQFTRLTGYSSEEVLGKNPRFLKSGEQPTEFYQQLWDTINSGKVWHGEFHNKKKNGELYWESASISPIMDGKGTITHFVSIKEDITNRKKTEEPVTSRREIKCDR